MNGILAVEKPSGVSSSKVVLQIQSIFDGSDVFASDLAEMKQKVHDQLTLGTRWLEAKIANRVRRTKIKMGHGGTLDPLASGVLIIGVGSGTKQLSYYLGECTKTYETRAVLGQSTTTGDLEGEVVTQTDVAGVTLGRLQQAAAKFVGTIRQTPPVYSALKVNGKPLYEYAREGIPVPKAIEPRAVKVHLFVVHDDFGPHDKYGYLACPATADLMGKAVFNNPTLDDHELCYSAEFMARADVDDADKATNIRPQLVDPSHEPSGRPPVFHATASVGSGTYIRSLVSDLGRAVGLLAFMAELVRCKQANWELGKNVFQLSDFTERDQRVWGPVLKRVLDKGDSVVLADEFAAVEAAV
ncbi:pseudouridine synthase, partial [Metschnikowia bicuspidata var. bicuspidata NRRL YB-4993]